MTYDVGILEHLDRVRRVRSVACPRCKAPKGRPCRAPKGNGISTHHQARWTAYYRKHGAR